VLFRSSYRSLFEERKIYPCIVQVSLGLKNDPAWGLADLPKRLSLPVARRVTMDGRELARIGLYQYANDPHMAPPGGTVMVVQYEADYDRWKTLRADTSAYLAEKARLLAQTIRALEERFLDIAARIEASDVATPISCERYTGNWRGSTQGWIMTTTWMKKLAAGKNLPTTFSGVDGFHLIGQWTQPGGGLPPAAMNGRDVVRAIMKGHARRRRGPGGSGHSELS
jgi:phytoene dehydrogenase-like protein